MGPLPHSDRGADILNAKIEGYTIMKLLISGLCGHMGTEVAKLALAGCRGADPAATVGVDMNACGAEGMPCAVSFDVATDSIFTTADCIVDFSHHSATPVLLAYAVANRIPVVLATTGHTEEEKAAIEAAAAFIPVFFAVNFSLGVALLIDTARQVAAAMPEAEIEIIEKHHNRKLDAPSGTALAIANALREVRPEAEIVTGRSGYGKRTPREIGIHSIRMGNIVGEHEVIIGTPNQTITLKHEAHDRALFAEGALAAAEFLCKGRPAGLYNMADLVKAQA